LADTFVGTIQTKAYEKFGRKGAWAYPGTVQILEYPLLSQEWVKIRTSNFEGTFTGSIGSLGMFPHNFPGHGEVANFLQACYWKTGVKDYHLNTTQFILT